MMDNKKLVDDKIKEMEALYSRMDGDRDLAYLKEVALTGFDNRPITEAKNVTDNKPSTSLAAITGDLQTAKWQAVVEGDKLSKTQVAAIESFISDIEAQADESLLTAWGIAGLMTFLTSHICSRGYIGTRLVLSVSQESLEVDCLPLDMRWVPFQRGPKGLEWFCNRTFRSAEAIMRESWWPKGEIITGTDLEVRDFWDGKINEIYVADQKKSEQANPFGCVPAVIGQSGVGLMLRDTGYLEHESESIFQHNRKLYPVWNAALTVQHTLGIDILYPASEQETDEPGSLADPMPKTGQVKKVKKGELHQIIRRPDLNQAHIATAQNIGQSLAEGATTKTDLGAMTENASALLITTQSEIRDKMTKPRIDALAAFRQGFARLAIREYLAIVGQAPTKLALGSTGRKRQYTAGQLGDPETYSISYRAMLVDKKQDIANIAISNAAAATLPLRYRLENVLHVEDPDAVMRELDLEQARNADPVISLFDLARRYAQEGANVTGIDAEAKKLMSKRLTARCVAMIKQPVGPVTEETAQKEASKPNSQALASLGVKV